MAGVKYWTRRYALPHRGGVLAEDSVWVTCYISIFLLAILRQCCCEMPARCRRASMDMKSLILVRMTSPQFYNEAGSTSSSVCGRYPIISFQQLYHHFYCSLRTSSQAALLIRFPKERTPITPSKLVGFRDLPSSQCCPRLSLFESAVARRAEKHRDRGLSYTLSVRLC